MARIHSWSATRRSSAVGQEPNHTSLLVGLFRAFPDAKILFAIRDPRDVILSTYLRFFSLTDSVLRI